LGPWPAFVRAAGARENTVRGILVAWLYRQRTFIIGGYQLRRCGRQNFLKNVRRSMGKTDGGGRGTPRREKRASSEEMQKVSEKAGKKRASAASTPEAEQLRKELAEERQRVQELENANARAAEHVDAVIKSVKAILDEQG
jgi:hypothetical protein